MNRQPSYSSSEFPGKVNQQQRTSEMALITPQYPMQSRPSQARTSDGSIIDQTMQGARVSGAFKTEN